MQWGLSQVFGDAGKGDEILDGDIITAMEFSKCGDFLAVGDKGGRVWVYQGIEDSKQNVEYEFFFQFQSHEPEFDSLKSLEIDEKINMIRFCDRRSERMCLLSCNDKTIRLWKISDRRKIKVSRLNTKRGMSSIKSIDDLALPQLSEGEIERHAFCKRSFSNAHAYHINSISLSADCEIFLSADDLRINLWNTEVSTHGFNIKPEDMEDLTEVITSASFHPSDSNMFMYSSSRGSVRVADLRESNSARNGSLVFESHYDAAERTFFSEIISSISDAQFTISGRHIISRDYLSVKIWDVRNQSSPVNEIRVHDYLNDILCDLYESDAIFDKFECRSGNRGFGFVTGSYDDDFIVHDLLHQRTEYVHGTKTKGYGSTLKSAKKDIEKVDFMRKSLHVAYHPTEEIVAVASLNNFYLYQKR